MDMNLKLSVTDSLRIAKLKSLQERLQQLKLLEELAQMRTTDKLRMVKLQGAADHSKAARLLTHEINKRAALEKLRKLHENMDLLGVRKHEGS